VAGNLGLKILVASQGGKSTLARALAAETGLPYIELDSIKHMAGWVERGAEDFRGEVQRVFDTHPGGWVIDGNYSTDLGEMVVKAAETVIFVNMPWRVMYWRTFRRSMGRAWHKRVLWNGNAETWRDLLFSRDSFLLWLLTNRRRFGARRAERLRAWAAGTRFIELGGRAALNRFYVDRGLDRAAATERGLTLS
jgi:adenylate kinase family enzyme